MNGLQLHQLISDTESESDFVLESEITSDSLQGFHKAISEASENEEASFGSFSPQRDKSFSRVAPPSPVVISVISDDDDTAEESLLESIEILKSREKQLVSTTPLEKEKRATPRMRRYFDSADTLKCYSCGGRGHVSQQCPEENSKPCSICAHPGHLERVCPNQLCFRCHLGGHAARDCRASSKSSIRICSRCGSLEHTLLDCKYQVREASEELVSVRCFICGNFGHLCCKNARKASKQPQFCSNCASKGHWHFDCPQQNRMTSYYDSLKSKPIDNSRGPICFTCTKPGHFSRECPRNDSITGNRSSSLLNSDWCFLCQVVGHRAGECLKNTKESGINKKRPRESSNAVQLVASKSHKQKGKESKKYPEENRENESRARKAEGKQTRKQKQRSRQQDDKDA